MAELARSTVAGAMSARVYPILLRERRLGIPEDSVKTFLSVAAAINIGIYLIIAVSSDGTRIEWRYNLILFEAASVFVWVLIFIVLWISTQQTSLLLTERGFEARIFRSLKRQIEWQDIASLEPAKQDVHITLHSAGEQPIALFADVFGLPPAEECFGAPVADLHALLDHHREANTAPQS
jgi:hypothetical protein